MGIHCEHYSYIEQKDCTAGLDAGGIWKIPYTKVNQVYSGEGPSRCTYSRLHLFVDKWINTFLGKIPTFTSKNIFFLAAKNLQTCKNFSPDYFLQNKFMSAQPCRRFPALFMGSLGWRTLQKIRKITVSRLFIENFDWTL